LSGRGLCDELVTRPEESYRLCCVVVCDLETSRMGAPYIYDISHLRVNSTHFVVHNYLKLNQCNMWLRMFSSEWCGRTEARSKIDKLYGILFYLTEIYSYMNRYTMTLKY